MRFSNNKLTICEVLRQINDRLQGDQYNDVRDMLALAEQMAKKIVERLRNYSIKDDPESWAKHLEDKERIDRELSSYLIGDPERGIEYISKVRQI